MSDRVLHTLLPCVSPTVAVLGTMGSVVKKKEGSLLENFYEPKSFFKLSFVTFLYINELYRKGTCFLQAE